MPHRAVPPPEPDGGGGAPARSGATATAAAVDDRHDDGVPRVRVVTVANEWRRELDALNRSVAAALGGGDGGGSGEGEPPLAILG